jgi:hypothetical protein
MSTFSVANRWRMVETLGEKVEFPLCAGPRPWPTPEPVGNQLFLIGSSRMRERASSTTTIAPVSS